jgi:acetyl-CoA C-acetyltransferase
MASRRRVALAGIHEFPDRVIPHLGPRQIQARCIAGALRDAGLEPSCVDAVYDAFDGGLASRLSIAEYVGLRPDVIDTTMVGGSSFEFHVAHAFDAMSSGRANVALLSYGAANRSRAVPIGTGPPPRFGEVSPGENMEHPWGMNIAANYALVAARHMHQYGTTPAQLAEIAVTTRQHALRNPDAVAALRALRLDPAPLAVDDVLASPMIADPLRRFDCCLVTDGGGAVVLVAEDVVPDIRTRPIWVAGAAEAVKYLENDGDITVSAAAQSGPRAFGMAGIDASDVDVLMAYDSFTITVLVALEDLGFCAKGEGGAYVERSRLRFDVAGGPALNTDGGGLSSNHPGMRGVFLLIEAARQLRGESSSQVPGAEVAAVHGNGGLLGSRHSGGTVVLTAG